MKGMYLIMCKYIPSIVCRGSNQTEYIYRSCGLTVLTTCIYRFSVRSCCSNVCWILIHHVVCTKSARTSCFHGREEVVLDHRSPCNFIILCCVYYAELCISFPSMPPKSFRSRCGRGEDTLLTLL